MARESLADRLEKRRLQRKLQFTSLEFLGFSYIILLGFVQIIASILGAEVSLQTPILILFYGFIVAAFFTILSLRRGKALNWLTQPHSLWLFGFLTLLMIWTAIWGKTIIPEQFAIVAFP